MFFPDPAQFLHCPNCRSQNLLPLLSYQDWECQDCGCRFPSLRKLDRQIDRCAAVKFASLLFLLFFIFFAVQILMLSLPGAFMRAVLASVLFAALLSALLWLFSHICLKRLERRRQDLILQCHCQP